MPTAPALPTVCTPSLLRSLRRHPGLPRDAWYLVAGVTLSGLNRPDELGQVFAHALEHGPGGPRSASTERGRTGPPPPAEQLRIARKFREALVRTVAIQGLPKAINALLALKRATPESLLDSSPGTSPTGRRTDLYEVPPARVLERGQKYFDRTYDKIAARVMGTMDGSGTEDLGLMARLAYGYILSCPAVLEPKECSFVLVAGLIPQDVGSFALCSFSMILMSSAFVTSVASGRERVLNFLIRCQVNPQLKGHLQGALNNGATVEEVKAVRETSIRVCEAAGMTRLGQDGTSGWGWRTPVANL